MKKLRVVRLEFGADDRSATVGRWMSTEKMQFRCTPRGTT